MKTSLRALFALAGLLGLLAVPAIASADTGSYTATDWSTPRLYNMRLWTDGGLITPPAGIPADATITSISGWFNWNASSPYGSRYESRVCDYADGEYMTSSTFKTGKGCTPFGTSTSNYWANTSTAYAGKPAATTQIYFSAQLNDGSTSNIHPTVSPSRYLTSKSITVNYTYTPPTP